MVAGALVMACGKKHTSGPQDGGIDGATPDASGLVDAEVTPDASTTTLLPVGAACSADNECSGPNPQCLDGLAPLESFLSSDDPAAQSLGHSVVVSLPDGYCSNEAPCQSDADCGDQGRCFLPLTDVDEQEYADLVDILGLPQQERDTLVGFHEYGQCLRPCEDNSDCTRPGYVCDVPLYDFVGLVESIGGRMETYCIGEPVDACDPDPCANGTCTGYADGTFVCECDQGWMGELCDEVNSCDPNPCANGTCEVNPDSTYTCTCDAGWVGDQCDVDDPCLPDPCLHGGTCTEQGGAAVCTGCDSGWSGDLCEIPYDCGDPGAVTPPLNVDLSAGTTLGATALYSCDTGYLLNGAPERTCDATGWTGAEPGCELEPPSCEVDTCNYNGTCVEVGGVFDHCDCDPGWLPPNCSAMVDCGAPNAAPSNGSLSYTTTTYGSTATYGCDPGYNPAGSTTSTCQADGTWSDPAPTCDPVDCGVPGGPSNGSVSYTTTTYGSTADYDCDPGFTLNGNASVTCQAIGTWSGGAPTCDPATLVCDVVYLMSAQFRISDAVMGCGNQTRAVGTNDSDPPLSGGETTPFDTSIYTDGFIRLRFPESGGAPAGGAVELIEYYLPMEFLVDECMGTSVSTDVDHSLGLLALNSSSPPLLDPSPVIDRPCQSWATGQLSGTTLDWSACDVIPFATGDAWSHDDAQAQAGDTTTACAMRMTSWGAVTCSGIFCGMVPGLGNQLETWDQLLYNFNFSTTDYSTASFSMPEVQLPESTSDSNTRTWLTILSATPVHVECGDEATITCDEVAP